MNYLLVISHKKYIIQTAQDKALLHPITDYNHSPQQQRGRVGAGEKEIKVSKESEKGGKKLFLLTLSVTLSVSSVYPLPVSPFVCLPPHISNSFLYRYQSLCDSLC